VTVSDYKQLFDKASAELKALLCQRLEINNRISRLTATVSALSRQLDLDGSRKEKLMELMDELYVFRPRLTDAVKDAVYYASPEKLPAAQVKDYMEVRGFNFSGFTNPLASVHSTLRRLVVQGDIGVELDRGITMYTWKGPHYGARSSLANLLPEPDVWKQMNRKSRARINRQLEQKAGIRTVP
jgi:hypothetical protein